MIQLAVTAIAATPLIAAVALVAVIGLLIVLARVLLGPTREPANRLSMIIRAWRRWP